MKNRKQQQVCVDEAQNKDRKTAWPARKAMADWRKITDSSLVFLFFLSERKWRRPAGVCGSAAGTSTDRKISLLRRVYNKYRCIGYQRPSKWFALPWRSFSSSSSFFHRCVIPNIKRWNLHIY